MVLAPTAVDDELDFCEKERGHGLDEVVERGFGVQVVEVCLLDLGFYLVEGVEAGLEGCCGGCAQCLHEFPDFAADETEGDLCGFGVGILLFLSFEVCVADVLRRLRVKRRWRHG